MPSAASLLVQVRKTNSNLEQAEKKKLCGLLEGDALGAGTGEICLPLQGDCPISVASVWRCLLQMELGQERWQLGAMLFTAANLEVYCGN